MKDITILIPIHKFNDEIKEYLENALKSVVKNRETYTFGELRVAFVTKKEMFDDINNIAEKILVDTNQEINYYFVENSQKTDFCSQINEGAKNVHTDYFSILEFDDTYTEQWFKMAHDYYFTHESVSVFLPINIITNTEKTQFQYCNELAWAGSFSNEIGFLDFDCLQDFSNFNLTGGIFNTKDFISVGGLKPSIKVAFNYEFLLRITKKELKVYVVPKEGYIHVIARNDSLTDEYTQTLTNDEIRKWFELAKIEYVFDEDRNSDISKTKEETLK